jgi:ketosteroid isomerase-like protein
MRSRRAVAAAALLVSAIPCGYGAPPVAATVAQSVPPAAGQDSLAQRVQQLEDSKEIHDLLIRYGLMLDSKDFSGYATLFSRDAVWIGGFGTHRTPAGIEAMLVKFMGPAAPGTRNKDNFHLLTNELITIEGDHAKAVSKLIFYIKNADGRPQPQMAGHYDDEFVREDGHWKFSRRVVQADIPYSDPLAGGTSK